MIYKFPIFSYDNPMAEKINKFLLFLFACFLLFLLVFPAQPGAQERKKIAVIPMKNRSEMPEYTTLCETMTDTVTSVIRYLPDYILIETTENPQMLEVAIDNMENVSELADSFGYDQVLYGDLKRNEEDNLAFTFQIYSREEDDIIVEQTAVAESLLDVFDTADTMTLDLLGQITDVNIGFGSIDLIKEEGKGTYEVYLNDKRIRNPQKNFSKVLNGSYIIEIQQDRILGDTVIFSQKIYVNEFQSTTVRFSIPKATGEEKAYLERKKEEVLAASEDPENLNDFLEKIAEFQEMAKGLDYDPELQAEKEKMLEEVGEKATAVLEEMMEDADEKYYSDNPDFEGAYDVYARVSKLVNNTFEYSYADFSGEGEIVEPKAVAVAPGSRFYLLDGSETLRLSSFDGENRVQAVTNIAESEAPKGPASIALDQEGNCLLYLPGTAEVRHYAPTLAKPVLLPIADYEPETWETLHLALSREDVVFLIGTDTVIVYEFSIGNEIYVERDEVIEQNLRNALEEYPAFDVSKAFFDRTNTLNLFSASEQRVLRFSALGEPAGGVVLPGASPKSDIAVDSLGYFYITMPDEHGVYKYSPDGELVTSFGSYGVDDGEFASPRGIGLDDEGTIYVADTFNNRVQILTLAAPPLLLPEVAQYGSKFSRRQESSEEAVERVQSTSVDRRLVKGVFDYAVPLSLMASSFGFSILDGVFYRNAMNNQEEYDNATGTEDVIGYRRKAVANFALSRASLAAGYAAMGVGSYLLASRITGYIDARVAKNRTIEQLQALDMDKDYILDEARYRSLETAYLIGAVTGVLPPVAGGAVLLALSFAPDVSPAVGIGIAAGLNAIPPIFSHVYGGQMSWGAFVCGIIADLFAITAFTTAQEESRYNQYDDLDWEDDYGSEYDALGSRYRSDAESMRFTLSEFYIVASTVIRLFAGIYDMQNGWVAANGYNTYEAVEERPSPLSLQAGPYLDRDNNPGVAFRLMF